MDQQKGRWFDPYPLAKKWRGKTRYPLVNEEFDPDRPWKSQKLWVETNRPSPICQGHSYWRWWQIVNLPIQNGGSFQPANCSMTRGFLSHSKSHDVCIIFLWFCSMVLFYGCVLWFSYGFTQSSLQSWFSYGFPMVFSETHEEESTPESQLSTARSRSAARRYMCGGGRWFHVRFAIDGIGYGCDILWFTMMYDDILLWYNIMICYDDIWSCFRHWSMSKVMLNQ